MGYHLRIESDVLSSFITTRTCGSRLWFINNKRLEDSILGYTAKYANRYNVTLYAFAIVGNHTHGLAEFPEMNRASYMRDLNSSIARVVERYVKNYPGGRLWARRYSQEFPPEPADIEDYFFYTVLQPVQDGQAERISDYDGYNCFHDAVYGIKRTFKVVRWKEYHDAKRHNPHVTVSDYTETVTLQYERLPGYEELSQAEYAKVMHQKLEERRVRIVRERRARGQGFVSAEVRAKQKPGATPRSTKTSDRNTHRPRILSRNDETRAYFKDWYFAIQFAYQEASERYRKGDSSVQFPAGTYPPWRPPTEPALIH